MSCSFKRQKSVTIVNDLQNVLDYSNRNSNKLWVRKGSKFYNRSMKSRLEDNNIEMYSRHNEGKSVVA